MWTAKLPTKSVKLLAKQSAKIVPGACSNGLAWSRCGRRSGPWGRRGGCEVGVDGAGVVALQGGGEVLDAVVVC